MALAEGARTVWITWVWSSLLLDYGVTLVGLLAGIGFTMSIFIASLAFSDPALLSSAKLSVLAASSVAAVIGLIWGKLKF